MLTYTMDVEPRSRWLRATPVQAVRALGFYCTEAGTFYCRAGFTTARSEKRSYLLCYTFSGRGLVQQADKQVYAEPGTLLLLDCRTPHSYCTAPQAAHWHYHWAHIDGTGAAGFFALLGARTQMCRPILFREAALLDAWKTLLAHARQVTQEDSIEVNLQVHSILQTAALEMLRAEETGNQTGQQAVKNVAAYMRAHYTEPLSVQALSEHAALSQCYLIRLFRRYLGTTPYDYLLRYRITKARELLCTTQQPISAIAEHIGFGNTTNFIAQFTRLCGQSPTQYRKAFVAQDKEQ